MDTLAFVLIVVFVIIALVVIFLRVWYLLQPYIQFIMAIFSVIDVIKSFTKDVILAIANYIRALKEDLFALLKFGDLDLVIMNNLVNCGSHLDDCIAEKASQLEKLGKKIIIGAYGKGAYAGTKLANLLSEKGKKVYLVLIEPIFELENDLVIPNKDVQIVNVLPQGEKAIVNGVNMFVQTPIARTLEGYIESIEKGILNTGM